MSRPSCGVQHARSRPLLNHHRSRSLPFQDGCAWRVSNPNFESRTQERARRLRRPARRPVVVVGSPFNGRGRWPVRRRQAATSRQAFPAATRHQIGTLARRDADGWCARGHGRQRPSGKERGKSASGSARRRRTLTARSRGRVRPPQSRSIAAGRQICPYAMRSAPLADATTHAAIPSGRRRRMPRSSASAGSTKA